MDSKEIKLIVSKEEFEFLRFQAVKHNTGISGIIKKMIAEKQRKQQYRANITKDL